jgi:cysteine-rich repeat protein
MAGIAGALIAGSLLHGCSTPAAPPATGQTASALTFPGAAAYIPVVQATGTMGDVTTDAQQDARNIVGSAAFPAVYFSNSGTELFVRLRLQENPIAANGALRQFGWGLLLNTDGNFDKYEYSLLLDASGNPDQIVYAHNTVAGQLGDPSDNAELVLATFPADLVGPDPNVEVVLADSCFDTTGNPVCAGPADADRDYFLSFGVPLSIFNLAPPLDLSQPVQILAGSSSSGQNLSLDLAGCDVNSGPGTIPQCQSLPTSLTCGNGVVEGSEGCDDGNGASADGCNAQCLIEDGLACNGTPPGATDDASCASGVCDTTGSTPGVCEPANTCGNGVLEAGEGCDDGATAAGDGCNAACLIEDGDPCNGGPDGATDDASCASGVCDTTGGAPGHCEPANTCGNGVREEVRGGGDVGRAPGAG